MTRRTSLIACTLVLATMASTHASDAKAPASDAYSRQAIFKLTFANRDLIWLGDPASPTALLYVKPGAKPIAADFHVRTLFETSRSPARRFMREARVVPDKGRRIVHAFTQQREKVIGAIDDQGRFSPNDFYARNRSLLPTWPADASVLAYDAKENSLYYELDLPGPVRTESLDFLPLHLSNDRGDDVVGRFSMKYPDAADPSVSLVFHRRGNSVALASATLPRSFRREDVLLGTFDGKSQAYLPESTFRAGADLPKGAEPAVTVSIAGQFAPSIRPDWEKLLLADAFPPEDRLDPSPANIRIDGNFEDWRNVTCVDDARGDVAPYLVYNPNVDILEFKVAHDDRNIYLYARVAGQVGRTDAGGRSYFYAYMDVDRNPGTGFLPTRDDDCYFGVDIGDDCEVQFEFVNNALRKTFYGFCGLGGNANVLKQTVTIGKSQYGRFDDRGLERADYKSEYIVRGGVTEITEDLKLGTSDTIHLAISPDGSEVEVASTYTGFLKDPNGRPTLTIGREIDIAVGMECTTRTEDGKERWAADSSIAIRGYHLRPAGR